MPKIKSIKAKEIKDSRGNPTIEVELENGPGGYSGSFVASVPSGASTGKNEAVELRDEDGKGIIKAIKNVNDIIAPALKGRDVTNQQEIDKIMIDLDGTENKAKLGANAILAVSLAVCRAGAAAKKATLYKHISELSGAKISDKIPLAMFNILNGGAHAKNDLDMQEFMIVLHKKTFAENLVACNNIFNNLKNIISKNFGEDHLELGDEGGFAPPVSTVEQALYLLKNASEGESDVKFALDCAASEFYENGKYVLEGNEITRVQLTDFYKNLVAEFPIISIEDPFSEEDWEGFKEIKEAIPKITIVGDDLTTTNIKKIREAHNKNACNGVILKLNQIGTVSETIEALNLAKSFNWKTIVSHRSGETMDDFIADFAVGTGADFIKSGSPAKEERMVKYQRLLEIEKELSHK
jgi:enolase